MRRRRCVGGNVGAEIRAAVQAGKEVTVHESAISTTGWTGYGYVITDPETGAGGYLIEGKGDGGWLALGVAAVFLAIGLYFVLLPFFILFAAYLSAVLLALLELLQIIVALQMEKMMLGHSLPTWLMEKCRLRYLQFGAAQSLGWLYLLCFHI